MSTAGALALAAGAGFAGTGRHQVSAGETLSAIAAQEGTTVSALASANAIADPDMIRVGRVLTVPGAPTAAVASTAAAGTDRFPEQLRARPQRLALRANFEHWAGHYAIPADLLEALCWMESGWQNGVVSSAGARGIGQLMPDTVELARLFLRNRTLDPDVPDQNIRMSAWYLAYLLRRTGGDTRSALGAYYQGLRSVTTGALLPETEQYVAAILALRPSFA